MRQRGKDAVGAAPEVFARSVMQRSSLLKQLGINCRWSSIVLDERTPRTVDEKREPYGAEEEDTLKAGDRAPNATGLVGVADVHVTSLFNVFSPTRHTVLIFGGDHAHIRSIVGALARYPKRIVSSVVLLSAGDKATTAVDGADATLRSGDAIAYDTYGMSDGQTFAVIVRPYGAIGAIVSGDEGW